MAKGDTKGLVHKNAALKHLTQAQKAHYQVYVSGAIVRDIDFELTADELIRLAKQQCHYCGTPPQPRVYGSKKYVEELNGIDRLDSTSGYTVENSVPACSVCNRIKLKMTPADYVEHAKRIVAHNATKG